MPRFFDPVLRLIVRSSEQELLAQIQFLKAENRVLRSKLPKRITITKAERRRLMRHGRHLRWSVLRELMTIVHVNTYQRWVRSAKQGMPWPAKKKKVGRPPTPEHIRALVIKIAEETGLGYTRIQGELNKLGIQLSRSCITNILRKAGLSPDPLRGEGRWDEFIKMHAETLWACDFLRVRSWTKKGLKDLYMLLFINLKTRQIHVTPATTNPTRERAIRASRPLKPCVPIRITNKEWVEWCRRLSAPLTRHTRGRYANDLFEKRVRELHSASRERTTKCILPPRYILAATEEIGQDYANDVSHIASIHEQGDGNQIAQVILENARISHERALALACAYAVRDNFGAVLWNKDMRYAWV